MGTIGGSAALVRPVAAATTRTAPGQDPRAADCVAAAYVVRPRPSCWGGGGGGGVFDASNPVQVDVTRGHFDVLPSAVRLRGCEGVDGKMPRSVEAPVAVLQAPLA